MGDLYRLYPDESPFGKAFQSDLRKVITEHLCRREMTYGEMIGIIEVEKMNLMTGDYDDEFEPA
jgi:hypothetical protein